MARALCHTKALSTSGFNIFLYLIVAPGGVPLLNSKFNIPEAESSVLSNLVVTASYVDSWLSYLDIPTLYTRETHNVPNQIQPRD